MFLVAVCFIPSGCVHILLESRSKVKGIWEGEYYRCFFSSERSRKTLIVPCKRKRRNRSRSVAPVYPIGREKEKDKRVKSSTIKVLKQSDGQTKTKTNKIWQSTSGDAVFQPVKSKGTFFLSRDSLFKYSLRKTQLFRLKTTVIQR